MANWDILKRAISDAIKTNDNQEITGQLLQQVLLEIVTNVGANATFAGIATPATNPGTLDGPVFYIASANGTYSNFGGITVENEVVILSNTSGDWVKQSTGFATTDSIVEIKEAIENIDFPVLDMMENEWDKFGDRETSYSGDNKGNRASNIIKELYCDFCPSVSTIVVYKGYNSDGKFKAGLLFMGGGQVDFTTLYNSQSDAINSLKSNVVQKFTSLSGQILYAVIDWNNLKTNRIDISVNTGFNPNDPERCPKVSAYLSKFADKRTMQKEDMFYIIGHYIRVSGSTVSLGNSDGLRCTGFIPVNKGESVKYKVTINDNAGLAFFSKRSFDSLVSYEKGSSAATTYNTIENTFTAPSDGFVAFTTTKSSFDTSYIIFHDSAASKKDLDELKKSTSERLDVVEKDAKETKESFDEYKTDNKLKLDTVPQLLNKMSIFHSDDSDMESTLENEALTNTRLCIQELFSTRPMDYKYVRTFYGEYSEALGGYMAGFVLSTDAEYHNQYPAVKAFDSKAKAQEYCKSNIPQYWGMGLWAVVDWKMLDAKGLEGIRWVGTTPNFDLSNIGCSPRIASYLNDIAITEQKKELDYGIKFFNVGGCFAQTVIGEGPIKVLEDPQWFSNAGITDFIPMKEGEKVDFVLTMSKVYPYIVFFSKKSMDADAVVETLYLPEEAKSQNVSGTYIAPCDGYIRLCSYGMNGNTPISVVFSGNTIQTLKNQIKAASSLAIAEKGEVYDALSNHPQGGYVMEKDGKVFIETIDSAGTPEIWWSYKIYNVTPDQELIVTTHRNPNPRLQRYIFLCDDDLNVISKLLDPIKDGQMPGDATEMIVVPAGATKMYVRYETNFDCTAYNITSRFDGAVSNAPAQVSKFTNLNMVCRLGYLIYIKGTPPQQSIASYQEAYKRGFHMMLADVRLTNDGHMVCWHDDEIRVVGDYVYPPGSDMTSIPEDDISTFSLKEKTLAELDRYDWGHYKGDIYDGTKILRIEQFIQFCYRRNLPMLIELKVPLTMEQTTTLCNLVKKYRYSDNVAFNCGEEYRHDSGGVIAKIVEILPDAYITYSQNSTNISNVLRFARKYKDPSLGSGFVCYIKNFAIALNKGSEIMWGYEYVTDEVYDKAMEYGIDFSYSELDAMVNLEDMVSRGFIDKFKFVASRVNIYEYFA